ncbi:MAG: sulfate ABC transporter permease subunit CysT [Victivallales bacterium]
MNLSIKQWSPLPGFGLTLGYGVTYLSLIVLLPLSALVAKVTSLTWIQFWNLVSDPRVVESYKLTFGVSLAAASVNAVFGLVVAWTLVRYEFPGRKILDAIVDMPFAMPTAISGIALATIYAPNGWIGSLLAPLGIKAAFTPLGITIALIFIGLPFVVRSVQPALQELDVELEDAARSLGATRWQTFRRVIFPLLFPSLLTGFTLAFARALGEYGSVVFISGNMPMKTEITSLLIIFKLEEYNYEGAAAIAVVMLAFSFAILLFINTTQWWFSNRHRRA